MSYYGAMGWISLTISVVVIGLALWALIAAAFRSSSDFVYAGTTKTRWLVGLIASLLVSLNGFAYNIPLMFGWLLSIAAIVAPIYYLGPVRSRMPQKRGPRGGQRSQRGGW